MAGRGVGSCRAQLSFASAASLLLPGAGEEGLGGDVSSRRSWCYFWPGAVAGVGKERELEERESLLAVLQWQRKRERERERLLLGERHG